MSQDESDGWSQRARIGLLVLGILLGAVAAPMIYAQVTTTEDYHMGEGMVIGSPSGLEVELGQNLTNDRQHLSPSNDAIDLRPVRLEADGDASATISGWDSDFLVLADLDASSNELRVRPSSQSDVNIDGAATRVEIGSVAVDDGTDDVRVTTTGSTTLTVWGLPADETVIAVDGDTGERIETVTTDVDGSATFTVSQDRDVRFVAADAPTISNVQPADGTTISNYSATISAAIDDPDFTESWGDNVTVTFEEADTGNEIYSTTISSAQTVSAEWSNLDMGPNGWRVVAEDSDGNVVTDGPNTIHAPDELYIRNEVTQELIDENVNATVEFYPSSGSGEYVQRETDNGVISLSGLPSDEEYTISVTADGYHARTSIIRDITEQQTVYMLPDNDSIVETVDVEFILDDYSGQFDASTSRLLIQRPIEMNGSRELQTVAADTFGAANSFTATLERDQRYVLIVENEEGIERPQGDYVARQSTQAVIEVGTIEWEAEESAYRWRAEYQNATDGAIITYAFSDPTQQTSDLEVVVQDRSDESNVLHSETFAGPVGNASFTIDVPPDERNTTWEVVWTATHSGEEVSGSRVVSGPVGEVENPLGGGWGILVVGILLVFVSLIFGGASAGVGAVVLGGFAALLWWIGWLPVPALVVVGAIIVAVLYAGGDRV